MSLGKLSILPVVPVEIESLLGELVPPEVDIAPLRDFRLFWHSTLWKIKNKYGTVDVCVTFI